MFANMPKLAAEMASKTSKRQFARMPDQVKNKVKSKKSK